MKSIKMKLIIYFSILILVSSIAIGFISIQRASDSLTEQAEGSLKLAAYEGARLMESRIKTEERTLEIIADSVEIQSMEWDIQKPALQRYLERTELLDVAIVNLDGTAYYPDGTIGNLGDREYIKKALKGETNISDLIFSKVTNELVLMYATPIENDGKVLGVLIGRGDGYILSDITDTIKFGENGHAYMINKEGTTVAHTNRTNVSEQWNLIEKAKSDENFKSLGASIQKVLEEKSGISAYTYNGEDFYVGYSPVLGTEWYLLITANKTEVLSAIPIMAKTILTMISIGLLISIAVTYIIGTSIAKPIIKVKEDAEKLADLDITQDVDGRLLKQKDEIGVLANSIQHVITNLRAIVNEINHSSDQVAASSEELTATSQQSSMAVEQVARAVEEVAKGAADQAQNTEIGSLKASTLGEIIERDQADMREVNSASSKVVEAVESGLIEIENLSKITDESSVSISEIHDAILKTNESSNRIGEASNVIASIAEQTNLLALNAAIEAARAGEAGRGFAVVAEEIRKLAEQSSISTGAIDAVVSELQSNAENAVQTVERVSIISIEQANSVVNSKEKFILIADSMRDAEKAVEKLNVSGQEMEKMKDDILDTIQSLAAIAEENSASTEEVSASIEEQAASMEEISSASEGLANLAQELHSIILRFKI